ncbi:MAG TPA: FAD-binding oxidoreductase [Jatrophihabitans sp.]|nr:FAD-binding oxidoreductase [Jatrophihabitans sp.]
MSSTADPASSSTTGSLWQSTARVPATERPSLAFTEPAQRVVDVAIVGAGYTGLWTAYYLHQADPGLRIGLIEKEVAGFGASGRNGGWCSGLYPVSLPTLAAEVGRDAALRQYRAMFDAVGEVGRLAAERGWPIGWSQGGTLSLARSRSQWARARGELAEAREFGLAEDDLRLLAADEARGELAATDVLGGLFSPHCAAVQPLDLARSLAAEVSGFATIWEHTAALAVEPGRVRTALGSVRAEHVVRATEGFTPSLHGHARTIAPVYSLMVATEPLPPERWQQLGLAGRATFSDLRHLIIYGQRTADDRIAFGGRGAPYHLGSRVRPDYDRDDRVFALLQQTLIELLPELTEVGFSHAWGGPLGISRDWHPSVGLDRRTGIGWAGGYVGDGVSTSNLAGRTLADLILSRDTELTSLPWVNHHSPRWEVEPLRWLGANAGLRAMTWADRAEQRHGRQSRLAGLVNGMMGR